MEKEINEVVAKTCQATSMIYLADQNKNK